MDDLIVDEVRRVRDAHAARFNYDLDAIFQDVKEQEKKSGLKFVSYLPRRPEQSQTLPTGAAASSAPLPDNQPTSTTEPTHASSDHAG
jgi:hypothetical protein